ncbi:hypothetical protein TVAG_323800 [Trichomonas vaginalis G3]|uniref:RING-type domain-containing protein n=1 Tax=Trichomonas vaginalis (strain ATCC PRA-98 / G3) TaxID=412133 RepID=A2F482_TRIV3|nr:RING/U-box family [Trichomonas vaginalis G3]EAY00261.1 hypothetical protein TVAG_323800 [Trichomonas vaginalis G3]KAI5492683.1 RING/U-box family [Trichomonas vaginalis G3]|eukprot:XP_001313190.1 hypothetical protein [Trichomonas vaginalis G3]
MQPVPIAIRTETSPIKQVLKSMFKISRVRPILIVILCVDILMFIIRVFKLKTFLIILSSCSFLLLIIAIIELCLPQNNVPPNDINQYNPVETVNTFYKPKYEVKKYMLEDYAGEPNICGICLNPIHGGDIAVLKCLHFFHPDCLEKWVKIRSTCPTCKVPID